MQIKSEEARGEYTFLRSNWLHFKWNGSDEVDDRMDKLNKMVSMMRGGVARRIEKEKKEDDFRVGNLEEQKVLATEYQRKYENLMMEKEELLTRLIDS